LVIVFYPLCYEGEVDLTAEKEFNKRHALEVQIMEFGQIPRQLFTQPYPERTLLAPQRALSLPPDELDQMKNCYCQVDTKVISLFK
jgi:hypothetical protein